MRYIDVNIRVVADGSLVGAQIQRRQLEELVARAFTEEKQIVLRIGTTILDEKDCAR